MVLNNDGSHNWEAELREAEVEMVYPRPKPLVKNVQTVAWRAEEDRAYRRPAARPVHRLAPLPAPTYYPERYVVPVVPRYYY